MYEVALYLTGILSNRFSSREIDDKVYSVLILIFASYDSWRDVNYTAVAWLRSWQLGALSYHSYRPVVAWSAWLPQLPAYSWHDFLCLCRQSDFSQLGASCSTHIMILSTLQKLLHTTTLCTRQPLYCCIENACNIIFLDTPLHEIQPRSPPALYSGIGKEVVVTIS